MNVPAVPAMPTDMIRAIGMRERWPSAYPGSCVFEGDRLTLFEWLTRSCSTPVRTNMCVPMNELYQKQSPTEGP